MIKRQSKIYVFLIVGMIITNLYAQDIPKENIESNISFNIRSFGIDIDGSFQESVVELEMDTLAVEQAFISVKIRVSSIETGISKRDKHLLKEKYFWQSKYPYILFETSSIEKSGDDAYVAKGQINMKGTIKNISIPFKWISTERGSSVHAEFELNRLEFNIGDKSWAMSESVKINVSFNLKN